MPATSRTTRVSKSSTKSSSTSRSSAVTKSTSSRASRAPRGAAARAAAAAAAVEAAATPSPEPEPQNQEVRQYTTLETAIATIFQSAQRTTATHRKLATHLKRIYEECIHGRGVGAGLLKGESAFGKSFANLLSRVLVVKKGEVVADRCIRFVELFVRGLVRKERPKNKKRKKGEEHQQQEEAEEPEQEEPEPELDPTTPPYRFVTSLLKWLTRLIQSKDKIIRYRTIQLIALLFTQALSIFPHEKEKRLFEDLNAELCARMYDKEPPVRAQAALALIRLSEMGVDQGDDEDEYQKKSVILNLLRSCLRHDSSTEVRKAILFHLQPNQANLPTLLERARDVDITIRRSIYTRILPTFGDFRQHSISMREKLLRWGITDRDKSVRDAAHKMFNYRWIEDTGGDIIEVLERIHVTGSKGSDGKEPDLKDMAMKGFWEERKDFIENFQVDDEYWKDLTPEAAFLVRSFNDFCRTSSDPKFERLVEVVMPEVSKLAYYMQDQIFKMMAMIREVGVLPQDAEEDIDPEKQKAIMEQEFIVEQMLLIALTMDYGDEMGRRYMFQLMRNTLAELDLPEDVTKLVVQCLARLSENEAHFCMLILEIISELQALAEDPDDDGADSFTSAVENQLFAEAMGSAPGSAHRQQEKEKNEMAKKTKKAKKRKQRQQHQRGEDEMDIDDAEDLSDNQGEEEDNEADDAAKEYLTHRINLKVLFIAQSTLENVDGEIMKNPHLISLLNGLIVPAVRNNDAIVRQFGLRCLGLSCLLDKNLAQQNLALFVHCFNKGNEELRLEALHAISDILQVHGHGIFDDDVSGVDPSKIYRLIQKAITAEDDDQIMQAAAVEASAKLMLSQVCTDGFLLRTLVTQYFNPTSSENLALRQTLTYFFPVYCHSHPDNQNRMQTQAISILTDLRRISEDIDEGNEDNDMLSLATIASQVIDWTDPRKQYPAGSIPDPMVHINLAIDMLERVKASTSQKEEKKLLLSLLSKLYIPGPGNPAIAKNSENKESIRHLHDELIRSIVDKKVAQDAVSRNNLSKFEAAINKLVGWLGNNDTVEDEVGTEAGAEAEAEEATQGSEEPMAGRDADGDMAEAEDDREGHFGKTPEEMLEPSVKGAIGDEQQQDQDEEMKDIEDIAKAEPPPRATRGRRAPARNSRIKKRQEVEEDGDDE